MKYYTLEISSEELCVLIDYNDEKTLYGEASKVPLFTIEERAQRRDNLLALLAESERTARNLAWRDYHLKTPRE